MDGASYLKLSFSDPYSGRNTQCTMCPLPQSDAADYIDYVILDPVDGVRVQDLRITVLEWYGVGPGLDRLELYRDRK